MGAVRRDHQPSFLKKALLWFAIATWIALLPIAGRLVYIKSDYMDFDVYYRAATRLKGGQTQEIYTLADGASPFRYAPPLLPLIRPLAALPRDSSKMLWFGMQWIFFTTAFLFLYAALLRVRRRNAGLVAALTVLAGIRLCLDTFTIGQVSSLLFLGFCAGLYAWLTKRPRLAGMALFFPAAFKVGPAILFGLFFGSARPSRRKIYSMALTWLAGLSVTAWFMAGSTETFLRIGSDWRHILAMDSVYYDASHYGSQSLNSFLLRLADGGLFSRSLASRLHLGATALGTGLLLLFWFFRRPRTGEARAHFYTLGLFAVLWFMPETFKYSLTAALIPFACIAASRRRSFLGTVALASFVLTVSVAGKDLMDPIDPSGGRLFFRIQELSLPFLSTLLLGIESMRLAWLGSIQRFLPGPHRLLPWEVLPQPSSSGRVSLLVPLSFERDSGVRPHALRRLCESAGPSCDEILLIPHGEFHAVNTPLARAAQQCQTSDPSRVRVLEARVGETRPEALRRGFLESQGEHLLLASLAQPCDPIFFENALAELRSGRAALVRGNRRAPETHFRIPVRLLSQVYRRHRLGLAFNRLIRALLPVTTSDTHSGNLGISRRLALEVFALQSSAGFLFDIEIALVAEVQKQPVREFPMTLELECEKTPDRVLSEAVAILRGIPRLISRYRQGCYSGAHLGGAISADDWGLSRGVNDGILALARLGVVHRVSLMANCNHLEYQLKELASIPGISLGLHFNLTYGAGAKIGAPSPARWLKRWLMAWASGRGPELAKNIRAELESQLSRLEALGVRVDSMDGHHHAHLVPGLIQVCAPVLHSHGVREVRVPYDPALWWTARWPLNILALSARRSVQELGFLFRPCFYPQHRHFEDPGMLAAALSAFPNHEVIVHPAAIDDVALLAEPDPYSKGRVTEYHALRMLAREPLAKGTQIIGKWSDS